MSRGLLGKILGSLVCVAAACPVAQAVSFDHVVSLGDSLLDDSAGVRSPVVAEHLAAGLGVPLTKLAVAGSTSSSLIDAGQHSQAAAQFGNGDLAVLWIGGNDFFYNMLNPFGIGLGNFSALDTLEANVDTILATLRGAELEVLVLNLPDMSQVPFTDTLIWTQFGLNNVAAATVEWNERLDQLAAEHGAAVADVYTLFEGLNADPGASALRGNVPVLGDSFGCQFCVFADSIHPGSYAQGYIANTAIDAVNTAFPSPNSPSLVHLSATELAILADIAPADFNGDLHVGAEDLAMWQSAYALSALGDADGDNDTDGADLMWWQRQHGSAPGSASATLQIPEPTSFELSWLAVLAVAASRRRNG